MLKVFYLIFFMLFSMSICAQSYQKNIDINNKELSIGFNMFDIVEDSSTTKNSSDTESVFSGSAYAYPSPALNGETEIGFRIVNTSMDVELSLFNSFGTKIYSISDEYSVGYNRVSINESIIGFPLSVGVYYFVLTDSDNELLSKGKFGVVR